MLVLSAICLKKEKKKALPWRHSGAWWYSNRHSQCSPETIVTSQPSMNCTVRPTESLSFIADFNYMYSSYDVISSNPTNASLRVFTYTVTSALNSKVSITYIFLRKKDDPAVAGLLPCSSGTCKGMLAFSSRATPRGPWWYSNLASAGFPSFSFVISTLMRRLTIRPRSSLFSFWKTTQYNFRPHYAR